MKKILRRGAAVTAAASAAITALVMTGSPAKATLASSTPLPSAPAQTAALAYSSGRAYVSWSAGPGAQPVAYQVATYLLSANGPRPEGSETAIGDHAVISGLQVGAPYRFAVTGVNGAGSGPAATTNQVIAVGAVAPSSPTNVELTASSADNQVTVSWQPSAAAPAAESYDIGVFEGTGSSRHQVGAVTCTSPCASEMLQATPGSTTSVVVDATNPAGRSGAVWSNPVTVAHPCALACLTVSTANAGGAESHSADGYLVTDGSSPPATSLTQLRPTNWRTNARTLASASSSALAGFKGATITELLSDDWLEAHNIAGYAITPWSNWSVYSQWVTSQVQKVEALGRQRGFAVTYWDVQNEPFGGHYYSPSSMPPASETIANFEQQFLTAYRAIKAADPNAQVIGPSLIDWSANPADAANRGIDMRSFLDFCVWNGIQLAGVSFHDDNFGTLPGWYAADYQPAQPSEVEADVALLRQMLTARPSLGHPAILVNEYGDPYTYQLPGWDVGRIAALEAAQVTGANRSCWGECDGLALDGLMTWSGSAPLPGYWVYSYYGGMSGQVVPVSSTYTDVTGLATVDPAGTVRILVGRHQSCTRVISPYCPTYQAGRPMVRVQIPVGSSAEVTTAAIPMGSTAQTPLESVSPTTVTEPVTGGWVTVTAPALKDGDAAEITVTPVG